MRHGFLMCPMGQCGDPLEAKIAVSWGVSAEHGEEVTHYRLVDYASHCKSCGWDDRFLPLMPTQEELQAAYAAGEEE